MDIHEERADHFQDFKNNKKCVYVIAVYQPNPAMPHFVFRKLDEERIAILAWRDKGTAEKWCVDNNLSRLNAVTELNYSELMGLLDGLNPSQRKCYQIEMI